jgi:hypothetical protein
MKFLRQATYKEYKVCLAHSFGGSKACSEAGISFTVVRVSELCHIMADVRGEASVEVKGHISKQKVREAVMTTFSQETTGVQRNYLNPFPETPLSSPYKGPTYFSQPPHWGPSSPYMKLWGANHIQPIAFTTQ